VDAIVIDGRTLSLAVPDSNRTCSPWFEYDGVGFRGSLSNVDVSSDRSIEHLNIEKSPRLHSQVLAAIIAAVGKGGGIDSCKNAVTKPADPTQTPAKPIHGVTHSIDPSMPQ
jgi:hypothetical protein